MAEVSRTAGAEQRGHMAEQVLMARESKAWEHKRRWEQLLRECYEFALPNRNLYYSGDGVTGTKHSAGQKKTDRLFDSTGVIATQKLANRIQSELTPPFSRWGKLVAGPMVRDKKQKEQVASILEGVNDTVFTMLSISNFDLSAGEFYLDLVTAGLAVMQIIENEDSDASPIMFVTIPQSQVAIEEGPWGSIWGYYRRHEIARHTLEGHWPDAELPEMPADADREKWHGEPVMVCEATTWSPKKRRWMYDVIISGVGKSQKKSSKRIVAREYKVNRLVASRWTKVAGEVQGRSPVMLALPDIKTLNKVKELVLQNSSIAVAGMWMVDNKQVIATGKIPLRPGVQIPVKRSAAGGPPIENIARPDGFDVAQLVIEELRMSINNIMMNKSLPPDAGPVRSATEIIERLKELSQDLGAPFGRMLSEWIRPLLTSILGVLHDLGVVRISKNAIKVDGAMVDIRVQSPMAVSNDLQEVETTVQWIQLLKSMGEESFMVSAKVEDVGALLGEKMGVPRDFIRPMDDRMKMQKDYGQMLGMQAAGGGGGIPLGGGGGANTNAAPTARIAA